MTGRGKRREKQQNSFFSGTLHFSPRALFKQPADPLQTFQAAPLFVFHSDVGTDLDKGDSGVYFLHLEAWNGGEGNSRLVLPTSWKQ